MTDEMVNRACDVFYGETFTDAHGAEGRRLVRAMLEAALASQSEAVTGSLIELDCVKFAVPSKVAKKIKAALAVDLSKDVVRYQFLRSDSFDISLDDDIFWLKDGEFDAAVDRLIAGETK